VPPPAPQLPWVSLIVPLVLAGLFSLIWSSPYALLIGVLAPTLALGHWLESRRRHRVSAREAEDSYQSARGEWEHTVAAEHRAVLQRAVSASPHPTQWRDQPLWQPVVVDGVRQIRVGLTTQPGPHDRTLTGIPALVGIDEGVAVVGSSEQAYGLWRVMVLGLCSHLVRSTPAVHPEVVWGQCDAPADSITVSDDAGREIRALRVDDVTDVPQQISVVALVGRDSAQLVIDGVASGLALRPDTISVGASRWVLDELSKLVPHAHEVSRSAPDPDDRSALHLRLSPDYWLDLVTDGPHAVIWGQTGSGKSVLIRQIIHSIAGFYRHDQVSVVVIDFKGGVGSSTITHYPHIAGVVSDLTPLTVSRAEAGIRAEIRRREQILASGRVDSIAQLAATQVLPRTVIIVDEVATLIQQHPQWEQLLSDIASRGRALGLHLICASQRVAGQIPRTVMVNSPLRICLRVSDAPEVRDFLPGVPPHSLSTLLNAPPGTAVVTDASGAHRTVRVEEHPPKQPQPGEAVRLWCEPLAAVIEASAPALAVRDRPDRQDQPHLNVDDVPSGLVWVSGDKGRGLSGVLARWTEVVDQSLVLPNEPSLLLDTLRQLREGILTPPPLVVADHLDRVLESVPTPTFHWCVEALAAVANAQRSIHAVSHTVVSSAAHGECASLLSRNADCTWRLGPTSRDKWRDSGLPDTLFDATAPPGRLVIDGELAQGVAANTPLRPTQWVADESDDFDLVVSGSKEDGPQLPDCALVIAAYQCDRHVAQIDAAYRRGNLGLHAAGTAAVMPFIRHHPPLPDPGTSRIWQVGVNGWRLRTLAS
jgi:S-DNA-T family DNA segregation ATPase FtsK/SpoIIIE